MSSAYTPKKFTLYDLYFVSRLMNPISLSTPIRARSAMTAGQLELADALPDPCAESPEERAIEEEGREECRLLLTSLSPRMSDILSWRYGFLEFPGEASPETNIRGEFSGLAVVSHTAIAEYLGLSRERIRQLENEALLKLREHLRTLASKKDIGRG